MSSKGKSNKKKINKDVKKEEENKKKKKKPMKMNHQIKILEKYSKILHLKIYQN